jgi:glycopeptide antibiotics resistance protein
MNLFGNIGMLMPFGILMPLLFSVLRKTSSFILCLLLFNLGIEVFQYYSRLGSFDVDDLILNSSGALLVYGILKVVLPLQFIKRTPRAM